jgi:hypothetical protein
MQRVADYHGNAGTSPANPEIYYSERSVMAENRDISGAQKKHVCRYVLLVCAVYLQSPE